MKPAIAFGGLLALWWLVIPTSVWAQRMQFPTQVEPQATASTTTGAATPAPAAPYTAPAPAPVSPAPVSPYVQPGVAPNAAPAPVAAPGLAPSPTYGAAPTYTPPSGVAAPTSAVPGAAVQPPPTTWDPYATPSGASGTVLPQDPYMPCGPAISVAPMQKFLQHIDLNFMWFAGNGDHELGIDDANLDATFAFPMFYNSATPLLVTPGFGVEYWSGPLSELPTPADMPARTYEAYLDAAWNPMVTEYFGGELEARVSVNSDFYSVTSDSIRLTGKGLAVIRLSPHMTVKAGVWYLNRVTTKLLPAGGLVWTPNPDIYFNILFPNPKIAKRITTWGSTEWWLYGRGEYGGGVWTVRRNPDFYNNVILPAMSHDLVDYNDIEIAVGLDFKTPRQTRGYFEVGLSCSRELNYRSGLPASFYPNNTVFIGGGLAY